MNNVINVKFKNHQSEYPSHFYSGWLHALHERCPDPIAWTYHLKFKVYETSKKFAVQFSHGIGNEGCNSPNCFSNNQPVYRDDLGKLWDYIFNHLESYNSEIEKVKKKVKEEKLSKVKN